MEVDKKIIEGIKLKAFNNLLKKVQAGDTLTKDELQGLKALEREVAGDANPEPAYDNRSEAWKALAT